MSKRTLSFSSSSADTDLSDDTRGSEDRVVHVSKFSRLSVSPSPPPASSTVMSAASPPPRLATDTQSIQCLLPPHPPMTFISVSHFESHLYSHHANRCSSCNNNFPTSHILDLHQAEQHDPLIAARREKGEQTFACLVPGCEKVCENRGKRRKHVVDKHGYRKDYDWAVVERGIDGRSSLLKKMEGMSIAATGRSRKMSLTGGVGERGVKRSVGFQRPTVGDNGITKAASGPDTGVEETKGDEENEDEIKGDVPAARPSKPASAQVPATDAAEDLVKSMSALRFVPPSVRRKRKSAVG